MIDGENSAAKTSDKGQFKIKVKSSAATIGVFTIKQEQQRNPSMEEQL